MTDEPRPTGSIRILGHPLHPMLTDIPIALWGLTLVWDLVAFVEGGIWWKVGFWTLALGLAASLPTAATGLLDSRGVASDSSAQRTVNLHLLLMGSAVMIFVGNLVVRGGPGELDGLRAALVVASTAIGIAVVGAGAWFGGELVFRHGVAVDRTKAAEAACSRDGGHVSRDETARQTS